jgi:hypothetical protein
LSSNVGDILTVTGFGWAQVLLRDPSDENVIPVVEELRRRLAPSGASHLDGKDNLSGQHDGEGAEEDGKFCHRSFKLCQKHDLLFVMFLYICNINLRLLYQICSCVVLPIFLLMPDNWTNKEHNVCKECKYVIGSYGHKISDWDVVSWPHLSVVFLFSVCPCH